MGFSIGSLLQAWVLFINALAILHEKRFLEYYGWTRADETTLKGRIVELLKSVRSLLRIPLIFINALVIVYELTLG